jgi:hypothetical protein
MHEQTSHQETDPIYVDLDLRLTDVWGFAFEMEDSQVEDRWNLETVGILLRAAYGQGYEDALTEPVVAQLHRDHGFKVPTRNVAPDVAT